MSTLEELNIIITNVLLKNLLKVYNSFTIRERNFQKLVIEMFKVNNGLLAAFKTKIKR